jgi:hypothetical protein
MDTFFGSVAQLLCQPEIFKEKYEFSKKSSPSINQHHLHSWHNPAQIHRRHQQSYRRHQQSHSRHQ